MELIYKYKLDSIDRIRKELKLYEGNAQYYDSGILFIMQKGGGWLKIECDSIQEFAFQLAEFIKMKGAENDRYISDNEKYNLILSLLPNENKMVSITEEWNDYNHHVKLIVECDELNEVCISLFEAVNRELAFFIPEIAGTDQFKEYANGLTDFLKEQ